MAIASIKYFPYRLNLENDSTYVFEISYLGYQKITDSLKHQEDSIPYRIEFFMDRRHTKIKV